MRAKLSKSVVDKLRARAAEYVAWDESLAGFGVKVSPSGRKTFVFKYRHLGRQRKLTLGAAGVMHPDRARERAMEALLRVRRGQDPQGELRLAMGEPTLADAFERFLIEHCEAKRKASTAASYRTLFATHAKDRLGSRKVSDVGRDDIAALHRALADTPYAANRTIAVLRKFFSWAEVEGKLRPERSNPVFKIEMYREVSRERFLSANELARLGVAFTDAADRLWPPVIAALRLLVFTGLRKNEALNLRWEDIDLQARRLMLRDSKTGPRAVALNEPAAAVLEEMARFRDAFPSPWVFPSSVDRSCPCVQIDKSWRELRMQAGLPDLRVHDLRHSFASVGAAANVPQMLLKSLLGHAQLATTDKYVHFGDDPARQASNEIANEIARHMGAGSNVRRLAR